MIWFWITERLRISEYDLRLKIRMQELALMQAQIEIHTFSTICSMRFSGGPSKAEIKSLILPIPWHRYSGSV